MRRDQCVSGITLFPLTETHQVIYTGSCYIRLPSSLLSNLPPLQGFPHNSVHSLLFLFIFLAFFLSRHKVVKVHEVVSSLGPSGSWGHPFSFFHFLLPDSSSWSTVFGWVPWKQTQRPGCMQVWEVKVLSPARKWEDRLNREKFAFIEFVAEPTERSQMEAKDQTLQHP